MSLVHSNQTQSRVRRRRMLAIQSASCRPAGQSFSEKTSRVGIPKQHQSPSANQTIREYLKGSAPRTWLFVGDSLGFSPQVVRRSYIEYFSDALRTRLNRTMDAIVDITVAESSVLKLRDNADSRLKRFLPDVVFLMPGTQDVAAGPAGRTTFQQALRDFSERVNEHGSLLVLATPPLLLAGTQETFLDLPAYIDIIRKIASERHLLVADHWTHWQAASEGQEADEWVDLTGTRLLHEGHRRVWQVLMRTLGVQVTTRRTPR